MAEILYRIADWDRHFENHKSRSTSRCGFCCVPNKQDGLGYGLIMQEEDGPAIYGAFVAILLMASKQPAPRHGYLTATGRAGGRPLGAKEIAVKTRMPADVIERALCVTSSPDVGWIISASAVSLRYPCADTVEATKEEKEEKEENEQNTVFASSVPEGDEFRKGENRHGARDENHDFGNISILHRPEMAEKVKLESFEDFMRADVVSIACTLADWWPDRSGKSGPAAGYFCKQLKSLASRVGDSKACSIIREDLFRFWSELRHGEGVSNPSAAITARVKAIC